MNDRNDDYLWDRSGPPDADVERLEGLLGRYRYRPPAARRTAAPWTRSGLAAAAVVLVALGGLLWLRSDGVGPGPEDPGAGTLAYQVEGIGGSWSVNAAPGREMLVRAGDVVETAADGAARLRLPDVGQVELRGSSRLELVEIAAEKHRLDLHRGTIRARIFAEPRVFQVGTEAAIAVDLGCIYELTVDGAGETHLVVESGRVSLEIDGRKVYVPAEAACRAIPGRGPGIPVWTYSTTALKDAIRSLEDAGGRPSDALVRACLEASQWDDSLTIWHLFDVAGPDARGEVFDTLSTISTPPRDVTREKCVALDRAALETWRHDIARLW